MRVRLNEKLIQATSPQDKAIELVDTPITGLILRVQPTGNKTFIYSYRNLIGKRKRVTLGRHGLITLKQAKELTRLKSADVARGLDPQAEIQEQRIEAKRLEISTIKCNPPIININQK